MSNVKKQHYVPQFYLKRFTHDGERLFVYDKFSKQTRQANVKDVAQERYFYDSQHTEKGLGVIERDFSIAIGKVLKNTEPRSLSRKVLDALRLRRGRVVSRRLKAHLSFFTAVQMFRTREYRNTLVEGMEKTGRALLNMAAKMKFPEEARDLDVEVKYDKKNASELHTQSLFDREFLTVVSEALYRHIWMVGINETAQPLYTSDHPVVKRAHVTHPVRSFSGVASKGIEIAYPLSTTRLLLMYERTYFEKHKGMNCKTISLTDDNVTYYNSLQVYQSYRQVYCPANSFALAEQICRESPDVCSPGRDRIQVHSGA
jgi:hypothetical protein